MSIQAHVPRKFLPLLTPARYKGAHGGRGGAKSHFFAEQAVLRAYSETRRIVCIREVQNSLRESVRQLIVDKIAKFGLESFFEVLEAEVRGKNGSLIIYKGMQSYNAETIKSLEGYDIAWVEEAQAMSDRSLRMLRPTIRKPGSEIWCSWNPRHDTDAVDTLLRGPHKPKDAIVVEVNWQDNPWFPDVLQDEMERDYQADPEMAEHVWGGGYELVSEGAYYARLIAAAEKEGRVGHFPYNPSLPVKTSWDIGIDDYMAIWFWQDDGFTASVIDYYEASGLGFDDVVAICMPEVFIPPREDERFVGWSRERALQQLDRPIPFVYGTSYLPHDVRMREVGAGGRSRVQSLQMLGVPKIMKGAATNPDDRIAAVRRLLPMVRFHMSPRVDKGIKRLRRYSRKLNDALGTYTTPLHDENSHGADAFGEYAINSIIAPPREKPKPKPTELIYEADEYGRLHANMDVKEIIAAMKRKKRIG